MSFILLTALKMAGVVLLMKLGVDAYENLTGQELIDVITDIIPNIVDFIKACFGIVQMFFELLPSHIGSVFGIFLSIMSIIVLFKLVYKGGS